MARPSKCTVDYFPHYCDHGKTIFTIESIYGNDGYCFWFKLLEILGKSNQHYYDLNKKENVHYLCARTKMEEEKVFKILDLLADLEAIDSKLWKKRIIWSQNFVEGVKDAYRNRIVDVPNKPGNNTVSDVRKPQSKVKEIKEKYFNEFWELYPKKVDKQKSKQKYLSDTFKLTEKKHREIMKGLKRYIEYWNQNGTEKQYIFGAFVFLHNERWNDQLELKETIGGLDG